MHVDSKRVEAIFLAALDQSDRQARFALLDRECAGDSELRKRVEELLMASQNPDSLLDGPALAAAFLSEGEATQALEGSTNDAAARIEAPTIAEPSTSGEGFDFLAAPTKPGSIGQLSHYEIREVIGKGGFGTVFKAFDEKLHRVVAIKVLSPELSASGSARQRFIREARTAAAVTHEHVVTIHVVDEDHRPPYIVMQLIDGVTLQQKLDKVGALSLREILRIGMQMAEGLAAAHKQGLVHRDIKPANVLLENGIERVKITDFGLARAVDDASVTQSGTVAGTPMYMSPEQAEGLAIDHRSDLFSLGTVLYAMCTGHPPFRASGTHAVLKRVIDASPRPIREANPDVPDWLCDIIAKLHARKPEDRFQTAKELAELLGQRLADVQAGREVRRAEGRKTPVEAATIKHGATGLGSRQRLVYATLALFALASAVIAFTELTGVSRFFHGPRRHEVTILVDDPNVNVRICAAPDEETPEEFAARFQELARLNDLTKAPLAGIKFGGNRISLPRGTKWWFVCERNSELVYQKLVTIDRDLEVHLPWSAELARKENASPKAEPGWVPLFNGRDFDGWYMSAKENNIWAVENGAMVNRIGTAKAAFWNPVYSKSQDFRNFHLRLLARLNAQGKASVGFGKDGDYGVRLEGNGSVCLWQGRDKKLTDLQRASSSAITPGAWFLLETIVQNRQILIKVNGKQVIDWQSRDAAFSPSSLRLGAGFVDTEFFVKDIEVKTLPPEEPGWVQLFNGNDLKDWELSPADGWKLENGLLVSNGVSTSISCRKPLFGDGVCRLEYKLVGEASASLNVRSQAQKPGTQVWLGIGKKGEKTGSITTWDAQSGTKMVAPANADMHRTDEWQVAEAIMRGNEMIVKIDGVETARHTFAEIPARGNVGLHANAGVMMYVRKLAIKELPSQLFPVISIWNKSDQRIEYVRIVQADFKPSMPDEGPAPQDISLKPNESTVQSLRPGNYELWTAVDGKSWKRERRVFITNGDKLLFSVAKGELAPWEGRHPAPTPSLGFVMIWNKSSTGTELVRLGQLDKRRNDGSFSSHDDKILEPGNGYGASLQPGQYEIWTAPDGKTMKFAKRFTLAAKEIRFFEVAKGSLKLESWELSPEPAASIPKHNWVPLFNGKDLQDWDALPNSQWQPLNWTIEDGLLVGRNVDGFWLRHKSGLYENFHLRAEVKLKGKGECGLHFRIPNPPGKDPPGYGVNLGVMDERAVGSLAKGRLWVHKAKETALEPDQWFVVDIVATGPRLKVLVNDQLVSDYTDPKHEYRRGHIAVQQSHYAAPLQHDPLIVYFKKIEIKELPPDPTPPAPKAEWESLFDGKELKPWVAENPKAWRVEDNLLIGELPESAEKATFLRLHRELGDFALKFEVRVDKLFAQINVRTEPAIGQWKGYRWNFSGHLYSNVTRRYLIQQAKRDPLTEGKWHTVEMTAVGDRFTYKVDGKDVASGIDTEFDKHLARGWLRIQIGPGTKIAFKNIELKDFSSAPPAVQATQPTSWRRFKVPGAVFSVILPGRPFTSSRTAKTDGPRWSLPIGASSRRIARECARPIGCALESRRVIDS